MENSQLAVHNESSINTRLDDSLFSKELAPHYMKLAGQLSSSELVPKSYRGKPQDLFICWAMGYQIGVSPEQAMQCIAVINGRPAMWGDDMLALCMVHKDFKDIIETATFNEHGAVIAFTCIVKRDGRTDTDSVFTLDMAKRAGLLGKPGPWTQYPERMLKLRARGFALRDAFPDALKGIKSREEVEDYIDAEYKVVEQKGSRTEMLKKDILNKMEISNVDVVCGFAANPLDTEVELEDAEVQTSNDEAVSGKSSAEMHSEIKRLIEEKGFTEDRIKKALKYYDAKSIETLTDESALHFLNQLSTLL